MNDGNGINTVRIDNATVHIVDLEPLILCQHWSARQREINELYRINAEANTGWKGFVLRILGIYLPDKRGFHLF